MIRNSIRALLSHLKRKSYANNHLDLKLLPYIDLQNGYFVEVGANDGINQSNTLYFEKYKGWRGLLIEAIPSLAEKCRENRPRCTVVNCALVAPDYLGKTIEMNYCNLMSVVAGGMRSKQEEQQHLQLGIQFLRPDEKVYTVSVPARILSDVLDEQNIKNIDLLSLDVEGYEPNVLKGIKFDRHQIEFILVEVRQREDIEAVIGHLYKPVAILHIEEDYSDILYRRR